ncbi:MAG: hypothetical protein OHK0017_12170 [Patescibacteria group bacterium]
MTTIITLPNIDAAEDALNRLTEMGVSSDQISLAAMEEQSSKWVKKAQDDDAVSNGQAFGETVSGIVGGGALGGVIGLLTGVAALTIPGLGPLLITGPLAAAVGGASLGANTLAGAAIGGTVGGVTGLVDGLAKAGVERSEAEEIESDLKQGGILMAVEDPSEEVQDALENLPHTNMVDVA